MKIDLVNGSAAYVDEIDFHWINQREWRLDAFGYVVCNIFGGRKPQQHVVFLHRLILLAPDSATVDHIDLNPLNNRRSNLRLATLSQQNANRGRSFGKSQFKGVYRRSDGRKWCAQIGWQGSRFCLGSFETEEDAARAYNFAAADLMGEFCRLNDVTPKFPADSIQLRGYPRRERQP